MDLQKIGRFLAERRKALGLTQRQVAEKLGMSDKSVSKWERGVCLPDVSVYQELCGILGISINEFLAGEPIGREELETRSEDNLIQVTAEGKRRQRRLREIAVLFLVIAALALVLAAFALVRARKPMNYIAALDKDSPEQKTAELISGIDGAYLFRYETDVPYRTVTITAYEYRRGELTDRQALAAGYSDTDPPGAGMIVLIPDFERFVIRAVLADGSSKLSTELPILADAEEREYWGRAAVRMEGAAPIRGGADQSLLALVYDPDEMRVLQLSSLEQGEFSPENEYLYYFTVRFEP